MLKAVFFDLDGTLGNTLPLCVEAFRRAAETLTGQRHGDEEIMSTFGPSEEYTIEKLIPEQFDEGLALFYDYYEQLHDEIAGEPFDGINRLLADLKSKNLILGVVTGKAPKSAKISLAKMGLTHFFDVVVTGTPTGLKKEQDLKQLLGQYRLSPDEVLYVGDLDSDIRAAREAGVGIASAAWAPTANGDMLRQLNPDATFNSVQDLEAYIKALI